jgi:hypothetical protein
MYAAIFLTMAPLVSALVAVAGLLIALRQTRESALRRADVLAWANDAIRELQSLLLISMPDQNELVAAARKARLTDIVFNTSVLVERGRLFFKNEIRDDHGQDKDLAYRGYRPLILDQIVLAHQIACRWEDASGDDRAAMHLIATECARRFVSLAQQEVGRSKTASSVTKKGGDGRPLEDLLKDYKCTRLEGASPPSSAAGPQSAGEETKPLVTPQISGVA